MDSAELWALGECLLLHFASRLNENGHGQMMHDYFLMLDTMASCTQEKEYLC